MKWIDRLRRQAPGPGCAAAPSISLPPELYQAIVRRARKNGVDPEALANELLREALAHRRLKESVQGRWPGLSPREREIARLAAGGLSNLEIAGRLVISPETVRNHLISALHKLGLERKAQLREALRGIDREESA